MLTPIKLVYWDHLSHLSRLVASSGKSRYFSKSDHEAAYKQLSMVWSHSYLSVIALRNPRDKQRYGLLIRTMVSGAVAAVLRYNVFTRIAAELSAKILGIPVVFLGYVGSLIPGTLGQKALSIFNRFCRPLGISLKTAESRVGERVVFSASMGPSHRRKTTWRFPPG